jgi:hypothetical protein
VFFVAISLAFFAPDLVRAAIEGRLLRTIGLNFLYAPVIVRLQRRDLILDRVTARPTTEWIARQITEAYPWDEAPCCLIRDDIDYAKIEEHWRGGASALISSRQRPWRIRCIASFLREFHMTVPMTVLRKAGMAAWRHCRT